MARSGLYKSEVKKARDALIAQGKHPSVDAVRIALGNTGSKTTIHKYLKELEEEEGGDGRKTSISEALQDLTTRLAAQLQEEAQAQIDVIRGQHAEQERQHAQEMAALEKKMEGAHYQLQHLEAALQEEQTAHRHTHEAMQKETVARHIAEQQVADLKERLAENEKHCQSLEEKHQHAREALEHYRQSVKEQRDQDQRRHEQQVQQLQAEMRQLQQSLIVKQEDITRLNQEGARLVADLSHAQKLIYDQQADRRQLEQKLEALQAVEQRGKLLEAQLNEKDAYVKEIKSQAADESKRAAEFSKQAQDLAVELAAVRATLEAQQTMSAELRMYMELREGPKGKHANAE